ncbi:aspartate dehydrogenase domain-containing protein-like [Daphnia carinata]|uniref:aspartate dehydrogenase domain-containing protein-like n=1 Tax=Daphnia carinata TaxID=120202 RepID=UPI0025806566|nr:aspartate dehydrogenase domain-containing protein-like [Daphnia carinata]
MIKLRIGIVGFGHLGQYLYSMLESHPQFEIAFVWNRSKHVLIDRHVAPSLILDKLENIFELEVDLIVEVAHPSITKKYGQLFLEHGAYFIGSPTALADQETYDLLQKATNTQNRAVYVPSGALWGGEDIRRMALQGTLKGLTITMAKHPSSFKLTDSEGDITTITEPKVVHEGSVRQLCPLAPNNVNTMAAAAVAASNLGFDMVYGRIIADPSLLDWHVIEVEVTGPSQADGRTFTTKTIRKNPADPGAVTGTATFGSFFSSLLNAARRHGYHPETGFILC